MLTAEELWTFLQESSKDVWLSISMIQ